MPPVEPSARSQLRTALDSVAAMPYSASPSVTNRAGSSRTDDIPAPHHSPPEDRILRRLRLTGAASGDHGDNSPPGPRTTGGQDQGRADAAANRSACAARNSITSGGPSTRYATPRGIHISAMS